MWEFVEAASVGVGGHAAMHAGGFACGGVSVRAVCAVYSIVHVRPVRSVQLGLRGHVCCRALDEEIGTPVAVDELEGGIGFEIAFGRGDEGAVGGVGDGAHPGSGEGGCCWEEG